MIPRGTILSRSAALLLLLAAGAIIYLAFVDPLIRQDRLYGETLATLRDQHARFSAEAATLPRLRTTLAAVKQRPGPQNAYVGGGSASRAAATLLDKVKTEVQASGATLASAQVLTNSATSSDTEQAEKISVRVQMRATPAALQRVFHGIESGRPALFLSDVTITGRHTKRRIRGRNQSPETHDALLLDVRFAVAGFRRARSTGRAEAQ